MTFKEAFDAACLTAKISAHGVKSRRFRNMCCPHNDGEYGVWYRVTTLEQRDLWPCYDECGTPVKEHRLQDADLLADTWELE